MRCVFLLALVAVACGQRYSDRVGNSRPVFSQLPQVLQPPVVLRPPVAPQPMQSPVFVPQDVSDIFITSPLPQQFTQTSFQESPQQTLNRPSQIFTRPQVSLPKPQVFLLPEPQEQESSEVIMLPEVEPQTVSFQPARPETINFRNVLQTLATVNGPQILDVNSGSLDLSCNVNGFVDVLRGGEAYHFSWCHDGGRTYTFQQAQDYCANQGFKAVSVETAGKHFNLESIMQAHNIDYIWTSGNKLDSYSWSWCNGVSSLYTNWATTGSLGLPQPDNASGNEQCLAVHLNNLASGAAWQDYSCTSRFPVVCQIPAYN